MIDHSYIYEFAADEVTTLIEETCRHVSGEDCTQNNESQWFFLPSILLLDFLGAISM
jgi:hypothetical protein